mmetsp:Transcript_4140/g.7006  ORF Transcript_4140/g.7006 Transcript_4140/m.7006 type:complete len:100 (+) Transcript_4140:527-826(+)
MKELNEAIMDRTTASQNRKMQIMKIKKTSRKPAASKKQHSCSAKSSDRMRASAENEESVAQLQSNSSDQPLKKADSSEIGLSKPPHAPNSKSEQPSPLD